jgi:hypothetical protein
VDVLGHPHHPHHSSHSSHPLTTLPSLPPLLLHPSVRPLYFAPGLDGDLIPALAAELHPAVVKEFQRALHAIFTAGAERRQRAQQAAAAALEEAFQRWARVRAFVVARGEAGRVGEGGAEQKI